LAAPLLAGCGSDYPVFHPAGPVARMELYIIVLSTIVMTVIILLVWGLFGYVLIRFRDRPGNNAPYRPEWRHQHVLEVSIFAMPVAALAILAFPMTARTYVLAHVPNRHPLVIEATSFDYKWIFQYPTRHIATVNYLYVPVGRPILFHLTAHSPMTALWVPNLGGMEYAMPNRVLPLWLEADRPGTYMGRNSQFNGMDYWRMTFEVHAVPPRQFDAWVHRIRHTKPAMTEADWKAFGHPALAKPRAFSAYPANTFPKRHSEFTVRGLYYAPTKKP
jgi:cytochrome aa3-600 menaquinol oxidase subunit 2